VVDLLLGSDIGLWVLDSIDDFNECGHVITFDSKIAESASRYGVTPLVGDANSLAYERSSVLLSVHYPRILTEHTLDGYHRAYNLHPGYLPWGRGYYPVFWALWEGTPAGATLHEIDAGVDTGKIVAQELVPHTEWDTGWSLLQRVRAAEQRLFLKHWDCIQTGHSALSRSQVATVGSYHARAELDDLRRCWNRLDAHGLVRLVRCLEHPKFPGLTVELSGERFEILIRRINGDSCG